MACVVLVTQITASAVRRSSSVPTKLVSPSTRRTFTAAILSLSLQPTQHPALAFDLRLVAPDQTPEEANMAVGVHARALVGVKPLMEAESWRELQATLRQSSAALKRDIYTIIQTLPRERRPEMRRLYSNLFNNVTRMDYAARSKDASEVQERYRNIVSLLNDIFTRIP